MRSCIRRIRPGPYQIQAAINAVHSDGATASDTDWRQILQLYDQLLALAPTPIAALNRAVALAEVHGPETALAEIATLDLDDYYPFHAVRGDLLLCLNRRAGAAAFEDAISRTRKRSVGFSGAGARRRWRGSVADSASRHAAGHDAPSRTIR